MPRSSAGLLFLLLVMFASSRFRRTEAIGVSHFCPHVLERLRFCRRSEYTIEDLDELRIRTPDTDPKLLQDIRSAITGLEEEQRSSSRRPPLPPLPVTKETVLSQESSPAVSPYAASADGQLIPMEELQDTSFSPQEAQAASSLLQQQQQQHEGRSLFGVMGGKKRGIVRLINKWILQDDRYNSQTSATARVVGHIAGDLMGLLVSEQFRQMGMLAGSVAKAGVKELATAGVDGIIRSIVHKRRRRRRTASFWL